MLAVTAESVVAVASKKTRNGEMPVVRVTVALSVNVPLVAVQVEPAGADPEFTVIFAEAEAEPSAPVHSSVYIELVVGDTASVPEVFLLPLHAPEATHDVVLVADQVSVLELPGVSVVGLAVRVTAGEFGFNEPEELARSLLELNPLEQFSKRNNAVVRGRNATDSLMAL
jgi:hypothetical protein